MIGSGIRGIDGAPHPLDAEKENVLKSARLNEKSV
jgi:hypothetical protein